MSLYDEFPGLREAVDQETSIRELSATGLTESICGVEVSPMMLRHLRILDGAGNAFVTSQPAGIADVLQLLWVLCPGYRAGAPWRRWWFVRQCRRKLAKLSWYDVCEACRRYIEDTNLDAPGAPTYASEGVPYTSLTADMVDLFGSEYGWTRETTESEPVKMLWQYYKLITKRRDREAPLFNRISDRVKAREMERRNKEAANGNV